MVRQCELLGLSRSGLYYVPKDTAHKDAWLMRLIDEQHTKTPFYGVPRITAWLKSQGNNVNHKRVARLMRKMGICGVQPKHKTSKRDKDHRIYPYLLTDLVIQSPNHVWSSIITPIF